MKFTMEECTMNQRLSAFEQFLRKEEKSENTIAKYMRDVRGFLAFLAGQSICKQVVMSYKEHLTARYAPVSVNSMLIAVNRFLRFGNLLCPAAENPAADLLPRRKGTDQSGVYPALQVGGTKPE